MTPVAEPVAVPVHISDALVVGLSVPEDGFAAYVTNTGSKQVATNRAKRAGIDRRLRFDVSARK
ncbi:MAG: hypothetical protein DMF64_11850 [Acidobacteria bacterium]|nr:MAG: hypothetical protein DMF64_11850 [Acidobacteriota bacterium]